MGEGGGFTRRRDCWGRRARGPEFRSPRTDTERRVLDAHTHAGRQAGTHAPARTYTHTHAGTHAHARTQAGTSRGRIECDRKISRDLINVRLTKSYLINIAAPIGAAIWRAIRANPSARRFFEAGIRSGVEYLAPPVENTWKFMEPLFQLI